jgi:threonine dehydrogenase-like Zn-dependent dehydrogenase
MRTGSHVNAQFKGQHRKEFAWFSLAASLPITSIAVDDAAREIVSAMLVDDSDPLGVDDITTHRLPLAEAPHGYDIYQKKEDGAIKAVLRP